ncbi:MAG: tRNA (N6-isopentenyl adenosine(37)-C2)-methylthiotransferase MiaB [Chlorobiaceae bacterium]|nr:tRNA (N6-isopentenyl adenosine(37)-C2)-methylthiotransferase MiaB [Chlorobiaceae bacterium]
MNLADSELVLGLLDDDNYSLTEKMEDADVVMVNTCSVRENAEQRIYGRLGEFKAAKIKKPEIVVGVLGCMAERLRSKLNTEEAKGVGQIVDVIVGPDEYRKLPSLLNQAWHGEKGIAVQLSRVETYDDITPLRTNGISAWISVMRGCNKFCSFCVVPFTRGRERSRNYFNIINEVEELAKRGFKDVTLLGQNVNSYNHDGKDFADLMKAVAEVDRTIRIRFMTSHPQDMSDKLIQTIASKDNICKNVHLPVQSGSDRILDLMKREYTSNHYRQLISKIKTEMPEVCLTTDIISGFPTETEDDHRITMQMLEEIQYDGAYMFKYSARENTPAWKMADDISEEIKSRRIDEIVTFQNKISAKRNQATIGKVLDVLIEGDSKKSSAELQGRTDGNKMVIFPKENYTPGMYIKVKITRSNSATLFGTIHHNHLGVTI